MASIQSIYTRTVHEHLGYRPVWLPGMPMSVGDVGIIEDDAFHTLTNLATLGIEVEEQVDDVADDAFELISATGCSVEFKVAGSLAPSFTSLGQADAGARVVMSGKRSVLLQLRGAEHHRIANQAALHQGLLDAAQLAGPKSWKREWVAITDVVVAASGTVLVASAREAEIELKAAAGSVFTSLADVDAGFAVARQSDVGFKVIAQEGMTALYKAVQVKRSAWTGQDGITTARRSAVAPGDLIEEAAPTYGADDD